MLKRLVYHSALYSLAPQLPKLAGIVVLPLVTPYLDATDYALFGLILTYTGFLSGLRDLGFTLFIVNTFYRSPTRWRLVWRFCHGVMVTWGIPFAAVQAALIWWLIPFRTAEELLIVLTLLSLQSIVLDPVLMLGSRYYQIAQKPGILTVATVLSGIVSIVVNLVAIREFRMGYLGWMLGMASGYMVTYVLLAYPVYFRLGISPIFTFRPGMIIRIFKLSLPTIPHTYSAFLLNTSDRFVMEKMQVPLNQIGLYNLGYNFGYYFEMVGNAIGMAIGPTHAQMLLKRNAEGNRYVRDLTWLLQALFLFAGIFGALWIREIMPILIRNTDLQGAYPLAAIIILSYTYRPMYWATINYLMVFDHTPKLWRITLAGGLLNVLLNIIFIPWGGVMASALATFASLLYIGFSGFMIREFRESGLPDHRWLAWLVIILLSSTGAYLMIELSWVWKLIATITVMVSVAIFSRTMLVRLRKNPAAQGG